MYTQPFAVYMAKNHTEIIGNIHEVMNFIDDRPHTRTLFHELMDLLLKVLEEEEEE